MKHVQTPCKDVARIETLIASFERRVEILRVDIKTEEAHAKVKDASDPCYPIIARQLLARRDNLATTITTLQALLQEAGGV
jgi:phage shock protein A